VSAGTPAVGGVHHVYSKVTSSPSGDLTLPWTLRFAVSSSGNPITCTASLRPDGSPIEADCSSARRSARLPAYGAGDAKFVWDWSSVGTTVASPTRVTPFDSTTACARPRLTRSTNSGGPSKISAIVAPRSLKPSCRRGRSRGARRVLALEHDEHVDAQVIGLVVHERRAHEARAGLLGGL